MAGRQPIEKQIKISVEQHINKQGKKTDDGTPWRNWKVRIYGLDGYGTDSKDEYDRDLKWVDHVVYNLHPSFKNPRRLVRKPPFLLNENGWGEFDMRIEFHFVDNLAEPHSIIFELSFALETYDKVYVLPFNSPSPQLRALLLKLSNSSSLSATGKKRRNSTASKAPPQRDSKSAISSTPAPPTKKVKKPNPPDADPKPQRRGVGKMGITTPETEGSETREETRGRVKQGKTKEKNGIASIASIASLPTTTMANEKLERLAKRLKSLEGDDIWEVVKIVQEAKEDGMYIKTDDKELSMDLYTLGDALLKKLEAFVKGRVGKKTNDKKG